MSWFSTGLLYYQASKDADRVDANKQALAIPDTVDAAIRKYTGDEVGTKAAIYAGVFEAIAASCALSLIPFESNFGSVFAGQCLHSLMSPAIQCAINNPIRERLDSIFRTQHLNARLLLSCVESGIMDLDTLTQHAIDIGLMDRDIHTLWSLAQWKAFASETYDDYAMLDTLERALLTEQIVTARLDIDEQLADKKARLKDVKAELGL